MTEYGTMSAMQPDSTTHPDHAMTLGRLDGDGIGPEIMPVATAVVDAAVAADGMSVRWEPLPFGRSAIETEGSPIPASTLDRLDRLGGWLLGPHDSASYPAEHRGLTPGAVIRKRYGLFANIRPCQAFSGLSPLSPRMDLVIVRENSEGLYADRNMFAGAGEFMPTPDVALATGLVTRAASERIARVACELAMTRRRRLTIVHKANVLSMTTGLFLQVCRDVAAQYDGLDVDDVHVDAMAAYLVRRGDDFDVVVTENLFGDILSDLAAELAGSLGVAPSINASSTVAMAQAAHGAAPDIAGRALANPTALVLSAGMLVRHMGASEGSEKLVAAADRIEAAVAQVFRAGHATADLGGSDRTDQFGQRLVQAISSGG